MIGTIVAATLEFDVLRALGGLPMLGVGLIEETSKLLVPLALLIPLRRHRTAADGLIIGVACGAGFAALETMGYAFTTLIHSGGSITDTVDILLLRGVLSPAGHMAWTGITAAALYAAAAEPGPSGDPAVRRRVRRCRRPARPLGQRGLPGRHRGRRGRQPRGARLHRPPGRTRRRPPPARQRRRAGLAASPRTRRWRLLTPDGGDGQRRSPAR